MKKPSSNGTEEQSLYRVQVLDRALGILEILWKEGPDLTQSQLCERVGLHKTTVHRLLAVLENHRLVERTKQNGKYRLGLRLFEMGSKVGAEIDLRERGRPHLKKLSYDTGETAHLCILDEGEVLYLEKVEAQRTVRVPSTIGRRYPAHCGAAGKALLAFLSPDELDGIVKKRGLKSYTSKTLTSTKLLKQELRVVRDRGYAVDNEEFEEGLRCIGAPLRDHTGEVIAAISIAGPAFRISDERFPEIVQFVVDAAVELSRELGYRGSKAEAQLGF